MLRTEARHPFGVAGSVRPAPRHLVAMALQTEADAAEDIEMSEVAIPLRGIPTLSDRLGWRRLLDLGFNERLVPMPVGGNERMKGWARRNQ